MVNILTEAEKKALRFYIGDVSGNDSFYGNPKAYVVVNSLFFPDISTETARANEGKFLNPEIIADVPRLISFFDSLFSVFRKSTVTEDMTTYRVERMVDYQLCRERLQTISMTSTSTAGFLHKYQDRKGIALMRFNIPKGAHCIDVAETLSYYAKPDEAEILLPPFMNITIKENHLTDSEMLILDSDGNQPCISCTAETADISQYKYDIPAIDYEGAKAGQRIYKALNEKNIPEKEDIEIYSQWKKDLQKILHSIIA
ncbi:MAG: ADP-ribosyltransferase [Ruminococcus sp.]|nr:ADP-ribosyltransferase [Ruminococcus sp.]